MRKTINLSFSIAVILFAIFAVSCNSEKAKLSVKGELLTSTEWKLDPNATLKGTTDDIKDTTGVTANIELKGDVKKIAEFLSETLYFGIDESDKSKLSYSRKIGEGFFSSKVVGFWVFSADEKSVILKEWDETAGKEKEPVEYEIVELSKEKLVLLRKGDASPNIYFPKK
jgi:hypothetical protein